MNHDSILAGLLPQFIHNATFVQSSVLQGGLINATYLVESDAGVEIVLQRVNTAVFTKPELVMNNIRLVTDHMESVAPDDLNLLLLPTLDGASFILDGEGGLWRAFNYLSGCIGYDQVQNTAQAYQAGNAFGRFLTQLSDLDSTQLSDTIPDFHHTPRRLQAFRSALSADAAGRAHLISDDLAFIDQCEPWIHTVEALRASGELPNRVTHNDTKISNVLFDQETQKAVCVIDLDTVMSGTMLYDFGDLVRTSVNSASEADPISEVSCRLDIFQALTEGYLEAAGSTLVPAECARLVLSGKLITLELALRFLTDFLNGDQYFRVDYPTQNLDRARNQLQLVRLISQAEGQMEEIVTSTLRRLELSQ